MIWFEYVESILLPLIIMLEILALVLLYRHKNKKRNKHQVYIIAALCISALSFIVIHIITYKRASPVAISLCWLYVILFIRFTYYSTMTILTVDRFLVFYLNIKYQVKWPLERILKLLGFTHIFSFVLFV